jgi:hypothetical protein
VHVARNIDFGNRGRRDPLPDRAERGGQILFFRLILGEHAPDSGSILFQGEDITACAPSPASAAA